MRLKNGGLRMGLEAGKSPRVIVVILTDDIVEVDRGIVSTLAVPSSHRRVGTAHFGHAIESVIGDNKPAPKDS